MEKVKVLLLKPEDIHPQVVEIEREEGRSCCDGLQGLVGGLFDCVRPSCYGIKGKLADYDIWVNDEGLLIGLPVNIALDLDALAARNFDLAGLLVGPVVVAGRNNCGDTTSVKDEDIPALTAELEALMLVNRDRIAKAFE